MLAVIGAQDPSKGALCLEPRGSVANGAKAMFEGHADSICVGGERGVVEKLSFPWREGVDELFECCCGRDAGD